MQPWLTKQKSHEIFRFHGIFWCSKAIQIRTISLCFGFLYFFKRNGLCTLFIVKGNQNLIVIQVNRIDECIHQCLPLIFLVHVELTEPQQPKANELLRDLGLRQLFFRNAGFKLTLGFFELLQPFLGGTGQDSGLNRIEHILDTRFRIPELLLVEGKVGILLVLQIHHLGNDGFHGGIILDKLHGLVDHQIFQPLFADGLFLAALVLFGSSTFIIAVDFARPARAALSKHQRPTVAAEQLGGEQIVVLCLSTGRSFLVFQHLLLYIVEKLYGHDGRNRIGNQDVPVLQFTNITAVAQHMLNNIEAHRPTALVFDTFFVQPIPNFSHGLTVVVPLEGFCYKRCGERVNFKAAVCIDSVAERDSTARELAFQGIFGHATHDLFGQVSRVIFGIALQHRLQNNTLRASRNDFRCRHQFHAVPLQLGLVRGTVIAVSGKAVELPDNDDVKDATLTVLNHLLELRAVIGLGGDGTVNVVFDHRESVLLRIGSALANLAFNGFFALTVSRIAGIDHGGHGRHLHLYIIERWIVLSKQCFV